ncbi:hypothetical protein [Anaerosporobacter sp.]|uniref:hypothetical protein n=1 Tax=Anaerosporobacter sp. TaxID=1872529 RepID=UPI00286F7CB6|nr:hypothetical protein [Anaerosporobacter sp.]
MKKGRKCFVAFVNKEFMEVLLSMKFIIFLSIITSNMIQFMTDNEVVKQMKDYDSNIISIQMGSMLIYLVVIVIMFVGHTLINRFIYEERKNKTIQVMLAHGMDIMQIWSAKMLVTVIVTQVTCWLTILSHIIFVKLYFNINITFNLTSGILTFITLPILCYAVLALVSICYWYFENMNIFSMIFPIISYLGIWNISMQLVKVFLPKYLIVISVALGILLFALSAFAIKRIKKEKIVIRGA